LVKRKLPEGRKGVREDGGQKTEIRGQPGWEAGPLESSDAIQRRNG